MVTDPLRSGRPMSIEPHPGSSAPTDRPRRRVPGPRLSSVLLGAGCLFWVLRDLHWTAWQGQLQAVRWWWVLPAVCCEVGSYFFDAVRWRLLLVRGRWTTLRALQAIYIGLLVNQVLPMRMGELARAFAAGRWTGVPVLDILPSLLVARLLDGLCMALGAGVVALLYPLPADALRGARLFGALILLLALLFALLIRRSPEAIAHWAVAGSGKGLRGALQVFSGRMAVGLCEAASGRAFWSGMAASAAFLLCQAVAFWLVMRAYGLSAGFPAGAAVFLLVHLGTAIPGPPANVGTFQLFTALGLQLLGIDKAVAAGFSVVVFLVLTLPLFLFGMAALLGSDVRLSAISARLQRPGPES